jgi:DNA-directed RNA polymerase specialized sigma24 family protein
MPTRHAETQRPPIELMLRNLPRRHREILVATYFHRRTTRAAARSLGLTPDTAKVRLYEAMRELSAMVATSRRGD